MDTRPIGIFDSGIGGLTVARALHDRLPHESLLYFGDTEHMPYGERSPAAIEHFSVRIAETLLEHSCKAILIACGTASAIVGQTLAERLKHPVPIINVIDPVVEHIRSAYAPSARIGVIGTKRTVESQIYQTRLHLRCPEVKVFAKATPLLAATIEEGFGPHEVGRTLLKAYLDDPEFRELDALILGCTHYPLVKKEIATLLPAVLLIDAGEWVADHVAKILETKGLLRSAELPELRFLVSDYTEAFAKTSQLFFGQAITLSRYPLWD